MSLDQMRWRSILIRPELSIMEAIQVIDKGVLRLAMVTDAQNRLQGVVTDGDVRRALLKRMDLREPVLTIMNPVPIFARMTDSRERILSM
ncbi:MAG: CBS domain-containing protein, partial [Magnetococcales bacterium]|nr:CBS domain-containing protein [Magnetococcales bacterium]